jgi:hypothetical protein
MKMSKNRRHELRLVSSRPAAESSLHAGKVVHDSRGNAVWDWAIDTTVLTKKTSKELLKSLEQPELSLEGDAEPACSWDPYNRSA